MRAKKIKKAVLSIMIILIIFFVFTEICIMKYLKEYGYGVKELPQTTLVYFRLSKGFTVDDDGKKSVFIGRSDYIYEDVFSKNGYYEADRMGLDGFYKKKDEKDDNTYSFWIGSTNDWCHWFRIYILYSDNTIESF